MQLQNLLHAERGACFAFSTGSSACRIDPSCGGGHSHAGARPMRVSSLLPW
jgi:hypothetical protein